MIELWDQRDLCMLAERLIGLSARRGWETNPPLPHLPSSPQALGEELGRRALWRRSAGTMRDGKRLVAHPSRDVSLSSRGQARQKEMAKDGVKTAHGEDLRPWLRTTPPTYPYVLGC